MRDNLVHTVTISDQTSNRKIFAVDVRTRRQMKTLEPEYMS